MQPVPSQQEMSGCNDAFMCFICSRFCCVQTPWDSRFDVWWDEAMRDSPEECEPEWLNAEDPLFILYTSGSTGKPKVRLWRRKYKEKRF